MLEEHVSRQTGKPEKLAFGSDYTPWTGLARWAPVEGPAKLLLAAGSRGLLVLPEQFGPSTRAEAIDVRGECADVLVDGGRVRVLVGGPVPARLELSPTATGLEPGPRLSLPQAYVTDEQRSHRGAVRCLDGDSIPTRGPTTASCAEPLGSS